MRYIEYIYLILSGMSFTFLVTEFDRLNGVRIGFVLLSVGIFAFMFTFRRSQRIRFEKIEAEQMEEMEKELADWAEEQEEAHSNKAAARSDEDQQA